jgi:alpha 1,3-glucosidase
MPFFRGHSAMGTKRREPWLYEKKYADPIKESIKDRYKLLPYLYNCFEDHTRTAIPILRPVWFSQEKVLLEQNFEEQERFMYGDALLVVPVLQKDQVSIKKCLKGLEGRWYDYYNKKEVVNDEEEIKTGLDRIGCFIKGGHIVPTFDVKTHVKSSQDAKDSNIILYVAADEQENAKGTMYSDDGHTFDFKKGNFTRKNIEFTNNTLSWTTSNVNENGYQVNNRVTKAIIMGTKTNKVQNAYLVVEDKKPQKVQITKDGNSILVEFVALANKNWKIVLE